ncbi:MAG: neutral zinc metallopeptidase [Proteobacteria bacterium]|nr:neutral zinc metallopeptidase [Pseudomonadota bacterium]
MKWRRARRSSNVEDRRGARPGGLGGGIGRLGLGGVIAVLAIGLLLGRSPMEMLGLVGQLDGGQQAGAPAAGPGEDDESRRFVEAILGETEDVWAAHFAASGNRYQPPVLVLFTGRVTSACGSATAAVGPFYCPEDRQVYIDLSFFQEMQRSLGGGGDFAEAYVIAHEVGHHVQHLTGATRLVGQARASGRDVAGADGLLVRQELQADCYAGVWAHAAQQRHGWLEPGDIEEALATASAIGDDHLQREAQGTVVPDSFTHGTAAQRTRWFRSGYEHGDPGRCDTFAADRL